MKNTRQCEPQTRTSVIQFEDVTTKIGVDSLFSRSLLGTITLEPLALPPETGGQTADAATLFLLPSQAASSAISLWSNARHRGETQPRHQTLRHLGPSWKAPCSQSCQQLSSPSSPTSRKEDSDSAVLWMEKDGKNRSWGISSGFEGMDMSF